MTVVGRNKLQQIRDAAMEELLRLSNTVIQTAIENIDTPAKWFDKSAYLRGTEEITMNSIFSSIDAGGQGTIALASLTQTSEYYLYTDYKAGTLSSRLRLASTQMEATVNNIMRTHIEAKTTWRRVQKSLNKVNASIGDVPNWLTELEQTALYYGGDRKAVKDALRKAKGQLKKLRPDRELRRSYQRVVEAVEVKNFDSKRLKSAMNNAVSQKAIYNNERIARTEIARAYNDAFHRRVEDDPTITAYRSILSSGHAETDECFPKGTVIDTIEGKKSIEDISKNDKVLTHNGRYRNVTKLYKSNDKELCEAVFTKSDNSFYQIFATPNHPVLTEEGWKSLCDLKMGLSYSLLVSLPDELHHLPSCDGVDKEQLGSRKNGNPSPLKNVFLVLCGVAEAVLSCRKYSIFDQALLSQFSGLLNHNVEESYLSLLANLDSHYLYESQTFFASILQNETISPLSLLHSWGYFLRLMHSFENKISDLSLSECTLYRNFYKAFSFLNDTFDSKYCCKTSALASLHCQLGDSFYRTEDNKFHSFDSSSCDIPQSTPDCKKHYHSSFCTEKYSSLHQNHNLSTDKLAFEPPFMLILKSYLQNILGGFTCQLIRAQSVGTLNMRSDVYNIEVEDDHTYVANGLVVHNCDHFAEVDAFGLGAGVYPAGQGYSIPYHSNCLCMMEPIVKHIDDKRRARFSKERFSEGVSDFKPGIQKRIVAMGEPRKPHALPKKLVKYD